MTNQEFSNEFDILYNNIMSNGAPGINEYEKSVFLTKAQYEIVKNYFNPKGNKYAEGLDDSPKRQIDLSMIIESSNIVLNDVNSSKGGFDNRSTTIVFPESLDNIMIILDEYVQVLRTSKGGTSDVGLTVIPIGYDEYSRIMSKPYKRPLKNQAWRLLSLSTKSVEIIAGPNDRIKTYSIRYVRRPRPIILSDLINASIEGNSSEQACELDPSLHQELLQRAVELAKATYIGDVSTQLELGKRSE